MGNMNNNAILARGIFWIVDMDDLKNNIPYIFKINCDLDGNCGLLTGPGVSENQQNYNHKLMWEDLKNELTHNLPFDYYPRGRVEISKGTAKIFLNPALCTDRIKEFLISQFGLTAENGISKVTFIADESAHYKSII